MKDRAAALLDLRRLCQEGDLSAVGLSVDHQGKGREQMQH